MAMARSVITALLAAALGAGAQVSCTDGPGREDVAIQRLETALCEKRAECGCPSFEPETCGQWPVSDQFGALRPPPDLAFDVDCQERWLAWVDTLSCPAPTLPRFSEVCPIYHGTIREGMPCFSNEIIESPCERGLLCIAEVCRDPLQTSFGGIGEPCQLGGGCSDAQARCIADVCQRLPSDGEPCLEFQCATDHQCFDDRCVPLPRIGETCQGGPDSCATGGYCEFDFNVGEARCEPMRDVGQPCQGHDECFSGNCPAGVCAEAAGPGDPCSNQLPCGPGSFCSSGVCQANGGSTGFAGSVCDLLFAILAR